MGSTWMQQIIVMKCSFIVWDFVLLFTFWDYFLWYFVLWDYIRVDFVLWDFFLKDFVQDSSPRIVYSNFERSFFK